MRINDPKFNIREIVKQLCLLEQHLLEKQKYCPDCISKHLLTLEGLCDEGEDLDTSRSLCQTFQAVGSRARRWASMFVEGAPVATIGQEVRATRKAMAQSVLDPECRNLIVNDKKVEAYGDAADSAVADLRGARNLTVVALGAIALWYWYDKKGARN